MTAFQQRQEIEATKDRLESDYKFKQSGARAIIGAIDNGGAGYNVGCIYAQGPKLAWPREWFNRSNYHSEKEAVIEYAKANFGTGRLKCRDNGTFFVY